MKRDAIIGARYEDSVFDSEFTITEIRAETDEPVASEEDVVVIMDYEVMEGTTAVSLDTFRSESGITLIDLPPHMKEGADEDRRV